MVQNLGTSQRPSNEGGGVKTAQSANPTHWNKIFAPTFPKTNEEWTMDAKHPLHY